MSEVEESFLTLADLKGILTHHKKILGLSALIGAFLFVAFVFTKTPIYTVEATFQEKSNSRPIESSSGLASLVFSGMGVSDSSCVALLNSRKILGLAISSCGLQITPYYPSRLKQTLQYVKHRFYHAPREAFQFEKVDFHGEESCVFSITFQDEKTFTVNYENVSVEGEIQVPVRAKGAFFTVLTTPKRLQIGRAYRFVISPLEHVVSQIEKNVEVQQKKQSTTMLSLSIQSPNVKQGERFLLAWAEVYLKTTEDENAKVMASQLDYLSHRKQSLFNELEEEITQGENYLRELIDQKLAVVGTDFSELLSQRLELEQELFKIEQNTQFLEKGGLENIEDNGDAVKDLIVRLDGLKGQRNRLWLNKLCFSRSENLELELNKEALASIRQGNARLDHVESSIFTALKKANIQPSRALTQQTLALKEMLEDEKVRSEERLLLTVGDLKELEGVSLQTAEHLFLQYSSQRDQQSAFLGELCDLKKKLLDEDNIGALFALRTDALDSVLCRELVTVYHQLKDESNLLEREKSRLENHYQTLKGMVIAQINQLIDCSKLRFNSLTEKMRRTNEYVLDASNREIRNVEKILATKSQRLKAKFEMSKEFYQAQLARLDEKMLNIPRLIGAEKRLQFHGLMTEKMLQAITTIIDQKILEKNLELAESGIVDLPYLKKAPSQKPALLFACIGGVGGMSVTFGFLVLLGLLKGMPVNVTQLRLRKLRAYELKDNHVLDMLREVIQDMGKVSSWIVGNGPDLIPELAALFSKQKKRLVVLDFDPYSIRQGDEKGFADVILGEIDALPIKHEEGYDLVKAGGDPKYLPEIIQRPEFILLLKKLESEYDRVVLRTKALPNAFEARMLLEFTDTATVFVNKELMEELEPYISKGSTNVTFIAYNE